MPQFDILKSSKRLRSIRHKMGYTQKELADKMGVAQCTIANCESAVRNLSIKNCYLLIELAKKHKIRIELKHLRPVKLNA